MKISHKLGLYLIITFGISWTMAIVYSLTGASREPYSISYFLMLIAYMFTPLLSVSIVEKLFFRTKLAETYPIRFRWNRWWLVAWLSPLAIAAATFGFGLLIPGVEFAPGMEGMFDKFKELLTPEQMEQMKNMSLPVHPIVITILQGLIAGITINAVAGFGEEIGWRGLMLSELSYAGFWKKSWIIGFVWGVWHAPVIMMGHNYPDHPVAGAAMMIIFCMLFSPFFTLVTIKGRSVVAAAILHGSFNALAATSVMLIKGGNDLLTGTTGLAGFGVLIILNLFIWLLIPEARKGSNKLPQ